MLFFFRMLSLISFGKRKKTRILYANVSPIDKLKSSGETRESFFALFVTQLAKENCCCCCVTNLLFHLILLRKIFLFAKIEKLILFYCFKNKLLLSFFLFIFNFLSAYFSSNLFLFLILFLNAPKHNISHKKTIEKWEKRKRNFVNISSALFLAT